MKVEAAVSLANENIRNNSFAPVADITRLNCYVFIKL